MRYDPRLTVSYKFLYRKTTHPFKRSADDGDDPAARFWSRVGRTHKALTMKKQNKNIREPYEPEHTPKPPQIIEPNSRRQREHPVEDEKSVGETSGKPDTKPAEKHHLLSDDADIDDETTV